MARKFSLKKTAKKAGGLVKSALKKRYVAKSGDYKYNQMFKDVMMLKNMVNAEKKNADITDTTQYGFAQNNGLASGAIQFSIVPTMAQGIGEDNRIGDSVKIVSMVFQAEVQTNSFFTLQDTRYKIYIVRQNANPAGATLAIGDFLEPNVFSGVIDYNSNRNYQHFTDFEVLGVINGKLGQNQNDSINQVRKNQHKIARKVDFHIRYEKGTNNIIQNQVYAFAVADSGDRQVGGTNIIKLQYSTKFYFYDN